MDSNATFILEFDDGAGKFSLDNDAQDIDIRYTFGNFMENLYDCIFAVTGVSRNGVKMVTSDVKRLPGISPLFRALK